MNILKTANKQEKGQVLVLTLIVVAFCSLIVVPLVNYMGTGIKAMAMYHEKTNQIYAADAGIQDGIWKINNGEIPQTIDYSHIFPAFTANGESVVVKVDYFWILSGIVDPVFGPHNVWADVTTSGGPDPNDPGVYVINLNYNTNAGNKKIDQMGVWLPLGFNYVAGSCATFPDNIETNPPTVSYIHGGVSIKWDNVNYSLKQNGGVGTQSFRFTPSNKTPKGDIAWVSSLSSDIGLSWDNMIWNYAITSTATNSWGKSTQIVSHVTKDSGITSGLAIITYAVTSQ